MSGDWRGFFNLTFKTLESTNGNLIAQIFNEVSQDPLILCALIKKSTADFYKGHCPELVKPNV